MEKLFYLNTIPEFITLERQSPVESDISSETQNYGHFLSSVKISESYVKPKHTNISEACWSCSENFLPENITIVYNIGVQSPVGSDFHHKKDKIPVILDHQ
jgi:hypothetical protein